jgi:hypothetical protein
MNEHLKSYLQFKTLGYKFSIRNPDSGNSLQSVLDGIESKSIAFEGDDADINEVLDLQNVCAKLPVSLVRRMEANLNILSMSKREFIEIAVSSALDDVERIMAENGVSIPDLDDEESEDLE